MTKAEIDKVRECPICGREFSGTKNKTCSERCSKKLRSKSNSSHMKKVWVNRKADPIKLEKYIIMLAGGWRCSEKCQARYNAAWGTKNEKHYPSIARFKAQGIFVNPYFRKQEVVLSLKDLNTLKEISNSDSKYSFSKKTTPRILSTDLDLKAGIYKEIEKEDLGAIKYKYTERIKTITNSALGEDDRNAKRKIEIATKRAQEKQEEYNRKNATNRAKQKTHRETETQSSWNKLSEITGIGHGDIFARSLKETTTKGFANSIANSDSQLVGTKVDPFDMNVMKEKMKHIKKVAHQESVSLSKQLKDLCGESTFGDLELEERKVDPFVEHCRKHGIKFTDLHVMKNIFLYQIQLKRNTNEQNQAR